MKKYILIPYANLRIGGVPTKIIDIVNALETIHPNVAVRILLQNVRLRDQRSRIHNPNASIVDFSFPFSFGRRPAYILWLWWNILSLRPVSILAFLSPYALPSLLAKRLFFFLHMRVIVSEDHYTQTMLNRMAAPFLQRIAIRVLYPQADVIITPTKSLMNQLGRLCLLPAHKTRVVFNWTKYSGVPLSTANRQWDMVHIGRLVASKHPYRIAQIMQQFVKTNPTARCVIVGEGEEMPHIKRFIFKNNLTKQIQLCPSTTDVSSYLLQSKIFIFLPEEDTEGFPLVLLEAMACGAIVITGPFNGADEVLTDGQNAFIVPASSITPKFIHKATKVSLTIQKNAHRFVMKQSSLKNMYQYVSALTDLDI